jgi:hypothetical protein
LKQAVIACPFPVPFAHMTQKNLPISHASPLDRSIWKDRVFASPLERFIFILNRQMLLTAMSQIGNPLVPQRILL